MNAQETILERNVRFIEARLAAGLARLREHYDVEERDVDPVLANPVIGGRPHHARRYDIAGVGNLLAMTVTESDEAQLSSFVITPYFKDLPLFSTDYVYSGERRFFLIEAYDLTVNHAETFDAFIGKLATLADTWSDMSAFPTQPAWYDDIRPLCIAKAPTPDQDDLSISHFLETLDAFIALEQEMPPLSEGDRAKKWQLNKDYADRLIDEGGVSTDLFTQALGPENTRRFFDEVFFAPTFYR